MATDEEKIAKVKLEPNDYSTIVTASFDSNRTDRPDSQLGNVKGEPDDITVKIEDNYIVNIADIKTEDGEEEGADETYRSTSPGYEEPELLHLGMHSNPEINNEVIGSTCHKSNDIFTMPTYHTLNRRTILEGNIELELLSSALDKLKSMASSTQKPQDKYFDDELHFFSNYISCKMEKYEASLRNAVQKAILDVIFKTEEEIAGDVTIYDEILVLKMNEVGSTLDAKPIIPKIEPKNELEDVTCTVDLKIKNEKNDWIGDACPISSHGDNKTSESPNYENEASSQREGTDSTSRMYPNCELHIGSADVEFNSADTQSEDTLTETYATGDYEAHTTILRIPDLNKRGKKSYDCDECGKTFPQKKCLTLHLQENFCLKMYSCDECGKNFSRRDYLKIHSRVHTGIKPFVCDLCGKSFAQKGNLRAHSVYHSGAKPFTCEECGRSYAFKSTLVEHTRAHTGAREFVCDTCGKSFLHKSHLTTHSLLHSGKKSFKCVECGKCFLHKSYLTSHALLHTGLKPYACDQCDKRFPRNCDLNRHLLTHSGLKRFACDHCGKSFALKSNLTAHSILHSGIKPFSCEKCGKCFTRKRSLATHSVCDLKRPAKQASTC